MSAWEGHFPKTRPPRSSLCTGTPTVRPPTGDVEAVAMTRRYPRDDGSRPAS
jgi:hypothetical protein